MILNRERRYIYIVVYIFAHDLRRNLTKFSRRAIFKDVFPSTMRNTSIWRSWDGALERAHWAASNAPSHGPQIEVLCMVDGKTSCCEKFAKVTPLNRQIVWAKIYIYIYRPICIYILYIYYIYIAGVTLCLFKSARMLIVLGANSSI